MKEMTYEQSMKLFRYKRATVPYHLSLLRCSMKERIKNFYTKEGKSEEELARLLTFLNL